MEPAMSVLAPETLKTRAGIELQIRPATEFDEEQLADFFDQVSDEDRRFRFFAAARHLGHQQLEPLVTVDHFRSESYLAYHTANGQLVATAQLACDNAMDTAEIAISVRDDYKGKGVAWTMFDILSREAERRGVRRIISIEDRSNHAAIELEQERGFAIESFDGDPSLVVLSKELR
jgi:acetyltransferase